MSKKVGPYGSDNGDAFDDGVYVMNVIAKLDGDGVRKVCVGEDGDRVSYIAFKYVITHIPITQSHGKKPQEEPKEFVLDYENNEYVKSVEGTYDEDGFVSSLIFKTSKERKSEHFGKAGCTKFVLEAKGFDELFVFLGRSSDDGIHALGAYFAVVLAPPVKKLDFEKESDDEDEWSGNEDEWDDGVHDNVSEIITVIRKDIFVDLVQFEYVNGTDIVPGKAHGKISQLPTKTKKFVLDEDEYITSVEGHYCKQLEIFGLSCDLEGNHVTMLSFKTNKETYQVLEHNPDCNYEGTPFVLKEEDHKIVGFFGKATHSLKKIGVYVKPIGIV